MTDPFVTSMIECRALDVSSRRGDELNNMLEVPVVADGENSLREREGPQELEALSNVITQLMEGVTNGQVRLVSLDSLQVTTSRLTVLPVRVWEGAALGQSG